MNNTDILLICEYNEWANARMLKAAATLTPEQLSKNLSSSFPSVRETLVHIYSGELIWLMRWKGISPKSAPGPNDFPTLESLQDAWKSIEMDRLNFLSKLSDEALQEVIGFENLAGEPFEYPLWIMIHHQVNHSTHHRGQISALLRQLDAKMESTDFTAFIREKRAKEAVPK